MKKNFLLAAVVIVACVDVHAQGSKRPIDEYDDAPSYSVEKLDLWSTDVSFNLFGNNFNNFEIKELNLRRYLDDRTALRLSLGFGFDKESSTSNVDNEDPNLNRESSYVISHSKSLTTSFSRDFNIGFGYEHHMDIFEQVDLFCGAELGYSGHFYSANTKSDGNEVRQNVWNSAYERIESTSSSEKKYFKCDNNGNTNSNGIFADLFIGADVYVFKNIYVGTELGVKYNCSMSSNGYRTDYQESEESHYSGNSKSSSSLDYTEKITTEYSSKNGVGKQTRKTTPDSTGNYSKDTYNGVSSSKSVSHSLNLYVDPSFHLGIRF